jgi:hypothetical protein
VTVLSFGRMSQVYGARRACPEHDLDVEPTQDRRRADTGALRPPLPYSRSASPLSHAERLGALARLALALYASLSPGVTRTFIRTLAGSFLGGCPLRLGSMGGLCTHK